MPTRPRSVLHAVLCALSVAVIIAMTSMPAFAQASDTQKLDAVLQARSSQLRGRSRVIVEYRNLEDVRAITAQSGRVRRRLAGARAHVADVDNLRLLGLAADPRVARVMVDRPAFPTTFRTGAATGAALVRQDFGVTGLGVGIAVIDSGISAWQDEIAAERIVYFKDFTREADDPLASQLSDEYGHGTHVASIAAGAGTDGRHVGMAPGAHLIGFKVIDGDGVGYISDVIHAVDEAIRLKDAYAIRIINLSVASGVFESYKRDPLTLAAERAFDAGIVVVAAAGNLGQNDEGYVQFGGVTSPGNAPWVFTVGATTHQGTAVRNDDAVAAFSSRGPTFIDFAAKPDLVAPGVGIEASAAPNSTLATLNAEYLVGTPAPDTGLKPYLSMSGTSMAAPVVAGTVALMLEANPHLTPNAVKGILQYTAQRKEDESPLAQGAGMLNALGAVRLARFFSAPTTELETVDVIEGEPVAWSREIIWGNYRISGGVPLPGANAWTDGLTWGSMQLGGNRPVVWGARIANANGVALELVDDALVLATGDRKNIVWATGDRNNIVWATALGENVVWGADCGGNDCQRKLWGSIDGGGDVWGTAQASDNVLWSANDRRNIVSATGDRNNIVWATGGRTNIVWATADRRNIVWATNGQVAVVWATGAEGEEAVWTTATPPAVVWADSH